MNVIQTPPVEIALRTLGDEDRQRVSAWFDHLGNWEKDAYVREHSQKLNSAENVYVLKTSGDIRIFFRLEQDRIVILDIATKATILSSGHVSEAGR
jgi:mRNA-degrading endonuclease RelE of RelBE toxin-antitoxin system